MASKAATIGAEIADIIAAATLPEAVTVNRTYYPTTELAEFSGAAVIDVIALATESDSLTRGKSRMMIEVDCIIQREADKDNVADMDSFAELVEAVGELLDRRELDVTGARIAPRDQLISPHIDADSLRHNGVAVGIVRIGYMVDFDRQ